MTRAITPALTAEEWAALDTADCAIFNGEFCIHCEMSYPPENAHGLAALALHGQPFGFAKQDVDALRDIANEAEELTTYWKYVLRSVADRIAALLPPDRSTEAAALRDTKEECYRQLVQANDDLDARDARIRDLEAQLASEKRKVKDLDEDYTGLGKECRLLLMERDLARADLARLTATDATPLDEVEVASWRFDNGGRSRGRMMAKTAVPVYEHPPRAAAVVNDNEPPQEFVDWLVREMPQNTVIGDAKWWAPRIWRMAVRNGVNRTAPEARVVGACVVRESGVGAWTPSGWSKQQQCETWAAEDARINGGTAHQLLLGDVIGGAT